MILKSLSRCGANPQYHKLIRYIADVRKNRDLDTIAWNTREFADLRKIGDEFLANAQFIRGRGQKRVKLYHEIVAFHPKDRTQISKEVINAMALEYLAQRSPNGLGFGKAHFDRDAIHIHFAISGNQLESNRANRMSKARFEQVKRGLDRFQRERFPDLKFSVVFSDEQVAERKQKRDERKLKREYVNEAKRREDREIDTKKRLAKEAEKQGKPKRRRTKKEELTHQIEVALNAKSQADFERLLKIADLQLLQRGKNWMVSRIETPKPSKRNPNPEAKEIKYRIKTLLPEFDFEMKLKEWEREPEQKKVAPEIEQTIAPKTEVQKLPQDESELGKQPEVLREDLKTTRELELASERVVEKEPIKELSLEEKRLLELKTMRQKQKLKQELKRTKKKERKRELDR